VSSNLPDGAQKRDPSLDSLGSVAHLYDHNMAELIESERSKSAILQRSQDHREEMFRVIQSGEAIAFVGAGLSHPLYPTWSQFLEKLASKATEVTAKSVDPSNQTPEPDILEYAQALQTTFRDNSSIDQYFAIFGNEFGPKDGRCTDQQRKLIRLPFKGFVTTNYDEGLEQAALDCGERRTDCGVVIKPNDDHHLVSQFLIGLDDKTQPRRIAHLHGVHSQTRHIIFTRSDYENAYGVASTAPWKLHRKLLWALLATRRLVFVGTSLDDPYLNELLGLVSDDLWNWRQSIHYLVSPLDQRSITRQQNDEARFSDYGIRVVYFDNFDGTYSSLDQLFSEALARCGKEDSLQWLDSVNADVAATLRST
jgi:hypothetical protein